MARAKKRESYGSGSVTQVKKNGEVVPNTYRVCINLGTDPTTGKRKKVQRVFHGSLTDARKLAKQLADEYAAVDVAKAHDTFSALVADWYSSMETNNAATPATLKQYRCRLQYVEDVIGTRKVATLKQTDIEKALKAVKERHDLSNTSMNKVFQVTRRVLAYAVNVGAIVRNPTDGMTAPKIDKVVTRRSLTTDEIAQFGKCLDRDIQEAYNEYDAKESRRANWGRDMFDRTALRGLSGLSNLLAVRLLLASGMRRGECLGLTWGNVDFANGQVHIKQTLTAAVEIRVPKTGAGVRSLYIDSQTMAQLKAWKAFQRDALHLIQREGVVVTQTDATPVFCNDLGDWNDPTKFDRWWRGYREGIGFPDLKVHELRHSQATQLLAHGADIKTVQSRLGHASASLTLNQYAHAVPANDRTAADLMGTLFNGPAKPKGEVVQLQKTA